MYLNNIFSKTLYIFFLIKIDTKNQDKGNSCLFVFSNVRAIPISMCDIAIKVYMASTACKILLLRILPKNIIFMVFTRCCSLQTSKSICSYLNEMFQRIQLIIFFTLYKVCFFLFEFGFHRQYCRIVNVKIAYFLYMLSYFDS